MVRLKSRYLVFDVVYPGLAPTPAAVAAQTGVTAQTFVKLVRALVEELFGGVGAGACALFVVKYFSPATLTGIIRTSRELYRMVCGALAMAREVGGRPAVVRVVHVGGTIKKCEGWAAARGRRELLGHGG